MTADFIHAVVAIVAAVAGATAGRAFAVEAESRLAAIFAGTYVGAGAGLVCAIPLGSLLPLVAQWLSTDPRSWLDALDVAGKALAWGPAAGAAGGLAVSIVIAALDLRSRKEPFGQEHR